MHTRWLNMCTSKHRYTHTIRRQSPAASLLDSQRTEGLCKVCLLQGQTCFVVMMSAHIQHRHITVCIFPHTSAKVTVQPLKDKWTSVLECASKSPSCTRQEAGDQTAAWTTHIHKTGSPESRCSSCSVRRRRANGPFLNRTLFASWVM